MKKKGEYQDFLALFLQHLNNYRQTVKLRQVKELYAPCDYILSLGGKRIRPLLALIACDLFDENPVKALDAALAVELFHNFSLIHDDILDKAPLRRGHPTVHSRWGNNQAILSGDVMLVDSIQCLVKYKPATCSRLTALLNETAIQVCEGQQMDMDFERRKQVSTEEYIRMISLKTAVLLGCSLKMGAICAATGKKNQEAVYNFGLHLGIAFQLLDDYLDVFADDAFGKIKAGDILAGKKTFLFAKALELSTAPEKKALISLYAKSTLKPRQKINAVIGIFNSSGATKACIEEAKWHTDKAIAFLNGISAPKSSKQKLEAFSMQLLNRNT